MSLDDNQRKVIETIIKAYQEQIRASIEKNMKVKIDQISKQEILGFLKHQGAGGTTYILNADFFSNESLFRGGIVVKFCNDLNSDVDNSNELNKLLIKRQDEWNQDLSKKPLPNMPEIVFSPIVLGTFPTRNVLILEFIAGGVPLLKANFSDEKKYQLLGYAIGRLHGPKHYRTAMQLYEPMFRALAPYFPTNEGIRALNKWKEWIAESEGGSELIHGDSHLENIIYSTSSGSLAWIEALLIPQGERMDDVAYAISHIIQEKMIIMLRANPNESSKTILGSILKECATNIVPQILTTYMRTAHISGLYNTVIPIDFFLGAHLIIRSQLFTDNKIGTILQTMGEQLIIDRPLVKLLGLEKTT